MTIILPLRDVTEDIVRHRGPILPREPHDRCQECFRLADNLSEDPITHRFVCDDCRSQPA